MRSKIVYDRQGGKTYFVEGVEVTQAEFDAQVLTKEIGCPGLANNTPKCWPMVSEALAVHKKQVAQANARNKRHGVHVTYDEKGRAHIPDRAARRDLLRLEALHDNDAGYSD